MVQARKKTVISPRVSPIEVPKETKERRKPGRPTRAAPSEVPMVAQEERNHMALTLILETHNTVTQI